MSNTINGVLYEELDLMPLKIFKPVPYDPAFPVTLTVKKGEVKLWTAKTKETELAGVSLASLLNTWGAETEKVIWIEARSISNETKSIQLQLKYKGETSDVFATAVWAEVSDVRHDWTSAQQLLASFPNIKNDGRFSEIKNRIEAAGGVGLVPGRKQNGILIEFYVYPANIYLYKEMISFATAQRIEGSLKAFDSAGAEMPDDPFTKTFTFPTMHPDASNDGGFPQPAPDKQSLMYHWDFPGFIGGADVYRATYVAKFETFVRANIHQPAESGDYPSPPAGGTVAQPMVLGSRISNVFKWSVRHTLQRMGADGLKRTTGDAPESNENYIREGWPAS